MRREPGRQGILGGATVTLLAESLGVPAGLITAAVLTRALGPTPYGRFTVVAVTLAITEWLLIAIFARAVVKFVAEADDWRGVAATATRVYVLTGIAVAAAFWLLAAPFAGLLGDPELADYLRLFAPQIPIFAVGAACRNVLAGRGRYREQALASAVSWIGRVVFVVGFVQAGWGIRGAILGSIMGTTAGSLTALLILGRAAWGRPGLPVRQLVQLAVPVFVSMICTRLVDQLGIFAVEAVGAIEADVGYYGAATNVMRLTAVVGAGITPVLIAGLSAARYADDQEGIQRLATGALRFGIVLFPGAAIIAASSHELAPLLFGTDFAPAAPLIAVLIFAAVIRAIMTLLSAILIGLDRAWLVATVAVPLPFLTLGAHLLVVPDLGARGAAIVTLLASIVGATMFGVAALRTGALTFPGGTLLRAGIVAAVCYAIAASIPTPGGLALVGKIGLLGGAALAGLLLARELSADELRLLTRRSG